MTPAEQLEALRRGDRGALARAITLVESERDEDRDLAVELLELAHPHTGGALRVGVSGPPGAGKSTFIEALGSTLADAETRVAVLAVDPSSPISGGSILGDKTRMVRLARHPNAFVRPSPTGGTLGGVAAKTREALLLCEAAGYEVVFVETVGVGQSELVVADMVDVTLALIIGGSGDELQGIKRGLLEVVDVVGIHKADGDRLELAKRARADYRSALRLMRGRDIPVELCSSTEGTGIEAIWDAIGTVRAERDLESHRRAQALRWMWRIVEVDLHRALRADPRVAAELPAIRDAIQNGTMTASAAARTIVKAFLS